MTNNSNLTENAKTKLANGMNIDAIVEKAEYGPVPIFDAKAFKKGIKIAASGFAENEYGMRMFLGQICSQACFGVKFFKNKVVDNVGYLKEATEKSNGNEIDDARITKYVFWIERNTEFLEQAEIYEEAAKEVYADLTGETYVPYSKKSNVNKKDTAANMIAQNILKKFESGEKLKSSDASLESALEARNAEEEAVKKTA
jgi:hypothetical protein